MSKEKHVVVTVVRLVTQSNLVVEHFGMELCHDARADWAVGELGLVLGVSLEGGCLLRVGDGETWQLV